MNTVPAFVLTFGPCTTPRCVYTKLYLDRSRWYFIPPFISTIFILLFLFLYTTRQKSRAVNRRNAYKHRSRSHQNSRNKWNL